MTEMSETSRLSEAVSSGANEADCIAILKEEGNPHPTKQHSGPLIWAAFRGYRDLCEALLDAGADVNYRRDKNSKCARDYAVSLNHHSVVTLLDTWVPFKVDTVWEMFGDDAIAEVSGDRASGIKLSHVFNFSSREKTVIVENIKTKSIGVSPSVSFDEIPEDRLRQAFDAYKVHKPETDETHVFGSRNTFFFDKK